MPVVEALLVVNSSWRDDVGTVVAVKRSLGKFYRDAAEYMADEDGPDLDYTRKRSTEEMAKDALHGIDTNWGRMERLQFGIALVDLPSKMLQRFVSCQSKLDMSKFSSEQRRLWESATERANLTRSETPVTFGPRDISANSALEGVS